MTDAPDPGRHPLLVAAGVLLALEKRLRDAVASALGLHLEGALDGAAPGSPPPDPLDLATLSATIDARVLPEAQAVMGELASGISGALAPAASPAASSVVLQLLDGMARDGTAAVEREVAAAAESLGEEVAGMIRRARRGDQLTTGLDLIRQGLGGDSMRASRLVFAYNNGMATQAAISVHSDASPVQRTWVTMGDDRVRPAHAEAEGQTVAGDAPFVVDGFDLMYPGDPNGPPELVDLCLTAGQDVALPALRAATRRWYEGDLVVVRFARCGDLTVTPNHPILRADGRWVAARLLQEGDDCVSGRLLQRTEGQPDVARRPSEVSDLYAAAYALGQAERVRGARVDFHGDGRQGEVEVVRAYGELGVRAEPASDEEVRKFGLTASDLARTSSGHEGGAPLPLGRPWLYGQQPSPTGGVSRRREAPALVGSSSRQAEHLRVPASSRLDTRPEEAVADGPAVDTEALGDCLLTLALDVATDEVLDVQVRVTAGCWVYNFDSGHGWYLTGSDEGVVSRNCRCWVSVSAAEDSGDGGAEALAAAIGAAHGLTPPAW